jgi:acetyl-CoA carboxylase biotin carboxyl carrier protein
MARDGRMFQPRIVALARPGDEGRVEILAPGVGLWRGGPEPGALVRPGDSLGLLEVLGVLYRLDAPEQARGVVVASPPEHAPDHARAPGPGARRPVAHGQRLLLVDPGLTFGHRADPGADAAGAGKQPDAGGLVFRTPMSGRFYSRASPEKPAFVQVGDTIRAGATVCLLEVMKTFNRVTYGGEGLPETARIKEIVPGDEDDLAAGDIILVLE